MKNLALIIFVTIVLALISAYISVLVPEFRWSFLSNLLANLIVAIGLTYFLSNYSELVQRPNLKIVFLKNDEDEEYEKIQAVKRADGKYEFSALACVENNGNVWLNKEEAYWHILFPNIEIKEGTHGTFKSPNHISSLNSTPLFPGRPTGLIRLDGVINREEGKEYKLYYFFSTSYGIFPETLPAESLKEKDSRYDLMGSIDIEFV